MNGIPSKELRSLPLFLSSCRVRAILVRFGETQITARILSLHFSIYLRYYLTICTLVIVPSFKSCWRSLAVADNRSKGALRHIRHLLLSIDEVSKSYMLGAQVRLWMEWPAGASYYEFPSTSKCFSNPYLRGINLKNLISALSNSMSSRTMALLRDVLYARKHTPPIPWLDFASLAWNRRWLHRQPVDP
jgi:hypothetical protein